MPASIVMDILKFGFPNLLAIKNEYLLIWKDAQDIWKDAQDIWKDGVIYDPIFFKK